MDGARRSLRAHLTALFLPGRRSPVVEQETARRLLPRPQNKKYSPSVLDEPQLVRFQCLCRVKKKSARVVCQSLITAVGIQAASAILEASICFIWLCGGSPSLFDHEWMEEKPGGPRLPGPEIPPISAWHRGLVPLASSQEKLASSRHPAGSRAAVGQIQVEDICSTDG